MRERVIKKAYDNSLKVIVDIDSEAGNQKDGFQLRKQYNNDRTRFSCVQCDQTLIVSYSSKDLNYFKHLHNSDYCIYKESNIDSSILEGYELTRLSKESDRHIELKTKIGYLLQKDPSGLITNLDIDSKFISNNSEKRRPDVFCHFGNKQIAFEIQLSYLPLHYINDRFRFYQNAGIYLIWIIDIKKSPRDLSAHQRDLKYACPHQNIFQLNEDKNDQLELISHYKFSYIKDNQYREKWKSRSVRLSDLQFKDDFSCYYYNYLGYKQEVEDRIQKLKEEEIRKKLEAEENKRKAEIRESISALVRNIDSYKRNDFNAYKLIKEIQELETNSVEELNRQMNLDSTINGLPKILSYIKEYLVQKKEYKSTVVELILLSRKLQFDINVKNDNNEGVIQYLYKNNSLEQYLPKLVPYIFLRGYKLTDSDKITVFKYSSKPEKDFMILYCYSVCIDEEEIEFVRVNFQYLRFVKAAYLMKRWDSKVNSWVKYMMPIMANYRDLWAYTKIILERTSLGEELKRVDRKKTIDKKIIEFNLEDTVQNDRFYPLLTRLFPQIFTNN